MYENIKNCSPLGFLSLKCPQWNKGKHVLKYILIIKAVYHIVAILHMGWNIKILDSSEYLKVRTVLKYINEEK